MSKLSIDFEEMNLSGQAHTEFSVNAHVAARSGGFNGGRVLIFLRPPLPFAARS
jgi:hypothetical protein